MIIDKFDIKISKETVFMLVDCANDNPVYEQVEEEYNNLLEEIEKCVQPKSGIIKGQICEETQVLYVLNTLGKKGPELVSRLFQEGNYLAGMIADAMLNDYLFQMDRAIRPFLIYMAQKEGKGIGERLEAPGGIDISIQKTIYDALDAKNTMGVSIKESFMLDPVKSIGIVYVLSDKQDEFKTEHDCSKCDRKECKYKNYENNSASSKQNKGNCS